MSIIMRNISGGSSAGSSSKGFPPGDITNIFIRSGTKCAKIKWEEPELISSYNGTTLSTWYSTILVRNDDHYPTSIKDGVIVLENTERNKYKDDAFIDNNVTVDKTYYYRFFTMSTDKVYNDSNYMICKVSIREYDPILKNNSWEDIAEASEAGVASDLWNIGDEIEVNIPKMTIEGVSGVPSSTTATIYNQTVTFQIWDFNHFDKSDGSGKAGICFGMKNLLNTTEIRMDISTYQYTDSGWNGMHMKTVAMPTILQNLDQSLQNVIKEVNTYANKGGESYDESIGRLSTDKLFIPGHTELFGTNAGYTSGQQCTESGQTQFPIFTDDNSRKKCLGNSTSYYDYWTRSPMYAQNYYFCGVMSSGTVYTIQPSSGRSGVCLIFNV